MAIFNSYVKLPEGMEAQRRMRRSDSRAVAAARPDMKLLQQIDIWSIPVGDPWAGSKPIRDDPIPWFIVIPPNKKTQNGINLYKSI